MTDAGLMGKASIDWDHLDATDSTGQLGSLINLARPRGFHVSAAVDEIFEVEEKLTGRCVCHGTAAQVHRWLATRISRSRTSMLSLFTENASASPPVHTCPRLA
jgi:hypothetical protein